MNTTLIAKIELDDADREAFLAQLPVLQKKCQQVRFVDETFFQDFDTSKDDASCCKLYLTRSATAELFDFSEETLEITLRSLKIKASISVDC